MSLPLVSICIPVYNGEPYIYKTLNSAINQTYKNIEILIFDNCSTDKTAEIIKTFKDNRITYHLNDANYGGLRNFNKCLESGNGEFIKLLNADDLLKPNAIEMQVEALINNPDASMCITATNVINEFDEVIMKRQLYKKSLKVDGRKIAKKTLLRGRSIYGEPSTVLLRRDRTRQVGYFSDLLPYSTDVDYFMRLSYVGDVYYINEFLSDWRVSSTNATSNILFKNFSNFSSHLIDWDILIKRHSEFQVISLNILDKLIAKTSITIMFFLKFVFLTYNKIRRKEKVSSDYSKGCIV